MTPTIDARTRRDHNTIADINCVTTTACAASHPKPSDDQIQAAREKERQESELRALYRTPPPGKPKHPPSNRSTPYCRSESFERKAAETRSDRRESSQSQSTPVTQPRPATQL